MKRENIHDYILRRLDESVGSHSRIASETGVSQATVSRIYLRKAVPRLTAAQALLDWFDVQDGRKGRRRRASPGSGLLKHPAQGVVNLSGAGAAAAVTD